MNLVIRPQELQSINNSDLHLLTEQFPYCQTSQLLYLLSLMNENNIQFPKRLGIVAAFVNDRRVLKDLVERFNNPHFDKKDMEDHETEKGNDESYMIDSSAAQPTDNVEYSPEVAELFAPEQKNISVEAAGTDTINEPANSDLLPADAMESFSFADEQQDVDQQPDTLPRKSKIEIIDQFIEKAPRITRSRSDFFNPVDYARSSTVDKEDIVSETLAMIYHNQGNIEKAIKIYEKLSLKYPEKSSYFAGLIKKIKTDNNLNTL